MISYWRIGLLSLFLAAVFCVCSYADAFSVRVVSSRSSLIFTDKEKVSVTVQVRGGNGRAAVEYAVNDSFGPWKKTGTLSFSRSGGDAAEKPLVLKLPGRGHYALELTAKCGNETARQKTSLAVIFAPQPSDINSPWGIFWVPSGPPGWNDNDVPDQIAQNMRLLGASWVRFNFWEGTYKIDVKDGKIVLDLTSMKKQVQAFHKAGLHIYGEIVMVPRVLASTSDESASGDAGPLYSRLKPKDYALWEQLVEKIVNEFKDDIDVWEIWNEADIHMAYWSGTPDEFVELVQHTSSAIRRGNPKASVVGAGFTSAALVDPDYKARTTRMFDLGIGKYLDAISIHYSDADPNTAANWKAFLKNYNLSLPLINSEEISALPLENLKHGIRTFKFIHIDIGYPALAPLLDHDWAPSPSAVSYSTGAYLLGSKKFVREEEKNGFLIYYYGKKDPVAVIRQKANAVAPRRLSDLSDAFESISITAKPVSKGSMKCFDIFGKSRSLTAEKSIIPFQPESARTSEYQRAAVKSPVLFITNCSDITSISGISKSKKKFASVAEAEEGEYSKGWSVANVNGWSGSKYLNIWVTDKPDDKGYYVNLKMNVPKTGEYVVYFSGNALGRLAPPCSVSPFVWQFDNGPEYKADHALPVISCSGAPEGLSTLGKVKLTAGQHTFHLRLLEPRKVYDNNYALWFDAIALMKQ